MSGIDYSPIIQDMTWSYSRVKAFHDCPYRWFLKYVQPKRLIQQVFGGQCPSVADVAAAYVRDEIDREDAGLLYNYLGLKRKELFFSSYGLFLHKLIELYYRGEKSTSELYDLYLQEFRQRVQGGAPSETVFSNYFRSGLAYLKSFQPFPYRTVAVEKRFRCKLEGVPLVGCVDYIGERDGELVIVDHKSKILKPRGRRAKPTKSDQELDAYLVQLYLYAAAVEGLYGKLPSALCFNCFRVPLLIEEPFREEAYAESRRWFAGRVAEITKEAVFAPKADFFKCRYLCEMQDFCDYCELSGRG